MRHRHRSAVPPSRSTAGFSLLELLVANAGWIVPHERLAARVWGRDDPADRDALRVYVRRLRSKLGDDASNPRYVETVRGVGYRLLPVD